MILLLDKRGSERNTDGETCLA